MILVGAVLFLLYAWRGNLFRTPSAPAAAVSNPVFVEIAGEVNSPGVYSFSNPPTLLELSHKAGGPVPRTDSKVTVFSGSCVEVTPAGEYRVGRMSGSRLVSLGLAVDVNTATVEDLEALPGLGPVLAQRVVQYRETHGLFRDLEDLQKVSGVGKQKLARLKPYLAVSPPTQRAGH
jgi:competence protein ComEA